LLGHPVTYWIPVFALPLAADEVPSTGNWTAYENLLSEATSDPQSGLRTWTSTNWWYLTTTRSMCAAWQIEGLEFLASETAVLAPAEALRAAQAVNTVLDRLQTADSIPAPDLADVSTHHLRSFINSEPRCTVESDQAEGFIAFLLSLRQVALETSEEGKHLAIIQPQP
jgi:hypothetical protein